MGDDKTPEPELRTGGPVSLTSNLDSQVRRSLGQLVLETTSQGVWLIDGEGRTTFVNGPVAALLGCAPEEMLGEPILAFSAAEDRAEVERRLERGRRGISEQVEVKLRTKSGSPVWTLFATNPVYDRAGNYAGALALVSDLTEQKRRESSLREELWAQERSLNAASAALKEARARLDLLEDLAQIDEMTGLLNRRAFGERLAQEMARAQRFGRSVSVMLIDIDRFKGINDTHGHAVGDQAIKGVADLLRPRGSHAGQAPLLRTTDVSGRYGGDELAVILPETQPANGALVAERLRAAAEANAMPIGEGVSYLSVTLSVGVAAFPVHARAPDALMAAADRALYEAKAGGRNRVALAD